MKKPIRSPAKAIREFCIWCMGGSKHDVRYCPSNKTCYLWPFRFGKNPYTSERRKATARKMAKTKRISGEMGVKTGREDDGTA